MPMNVFISWQKLLQRLYDKGIVPPKQLQMSDAELLGKDTATVESMLVYACTLLGLKESEVKLILGFRTYTIFYKPRVEAQI